MSNLIVVKFDNLDDAGRLRQTLKDVEKSGALKLDDTAVIVKDADGKVRVNDEIDRGVKVGAIGGGLLGMLLMFWFPIAGLAIGAAGGALVGKLVDMGIDRKFVDDVSEAMQPGSSALFAIVSGGRPETAIAAIEPYRGTLYHTSLPSDLEESLRRALQ